MKDGTLFADRFEVVSLATSGGMGTVYRARDRLTGEAVALKIIQQRGAIEVGRFLREGRALAELSHPAIVRYVAHGVTPQGDAYVAMEWLNGVDFGDFLETRSLTIAESVLVLSHAAEGLAFAHTRGLVHRDVKPSNLFLVDGSLRKVKVLDFGIVRHAGAITEITKTGVMLGTPGFMSPEQVRGRKDIDARADVFALGCVLYRCLTGRLPFASDDPIAILTRVLFEDVLPPRLLVGEISEELDRLVCRLLAKDPAERPADAGALLTELRALHLPVSATGSTPRRADPQAITNKEQKLLSIVLTGPSRSNHSQRQATLSLDQASSIEARLRVGIEALGGRFEMLSNGSFVVMSGGQGTPRDQAMQAARCALTIRAHLPDAPIAVATGRSDASLPVPVGEVIERAARLVRGAANALDESEATISDEPLTPSIEWEPESRAARLVRIDDVTAALLGSRFDITGETDALALVGERSALELDRTVLGVATPLVGRERELALLSGIFEQCVAEPIASAVLVTSGAGVGKSRLVHEFVRKLKRGESVEVWTGRGDPMSAGAPFAILTQALGAAMGLLPGESVSERRKKVEQRVLRHVPAEEASRVIDFLGDLAGVPFPDEGSVQLRAARNDPMLMGDQMRRAWEDFLAAECRAQPVLLVLEDLHWGDLPTVRFVDAALRQLADLPFMVLAAARPEIEELFPRLWAERRVQPLPLGELTARASEKLVREVLGARVAPEAVAAIVERAGGNVFYIEELIRAVAEGKGGKLPETVLAMTEARLESLDPEARRVLRAASVFGQSFWPSGVVALLGGVERASFVAEWMRNLVEREYVAKRQDSRFASEEEMSFRHALLREAAYAMLTEKDRTVGHKLAGEWLESHGEPEPLVLAHHFELGGNGPRALGWYSKSAEQALEGNDFVALIDRAGRAIACGAEGAVLGALRTLQLEGHFWRGESEAVERCGKEALESLAPGSAPYARAIARMVISRGRRARPDEVAELAERLVTTLEQGTIARGAEGAYVFALAHAAAQLLFLGRYESVEPLVLRADRIGRAAGERGDPSLLGWADDARSSLAMLEGDMGACVLLMTSAARHFVAAGDLRQACVEDGYVGYGYLDLGVFDQAEKVLRECIASAERLGLPHVVASARHNLGLACAMQGKLEEAEALLRAAITTFGAHRDNRLECASHKYLAIALARGGDLEGAEEATQNALAKLESGGPSRAAALAAHASVLLLRGRSAEALERASEAYAILRNLGSLDTEDALVRRTYAESLYATGNLEGAREAILDARDELLRRAAKISNPTWRRSFLEKVQEHARVFALVGAWSVAGS
jgi:serine/threonine protein kinase/tetratricopeptide (TPR) repeat protein